MNFQEKINEVIAANLPAATASELQSYLANAEADKKELAEAKKKINSLQERIGELEDENARLKASAELADSLHELEEKLNKRERDFELEIQRLKVGMMEDSTHKLFALVDKVFGIPTVCVSNTKDVVTPVDGGNGGCGFAQRDTVNETTTTKTVKA